MEETPIGTEIKNPNQKFVYQYDFNKNWTFLVELINVSQEENPKLSYPAVVSTEGIAPSQYGTKGLLGSKFADVEEKYDLTQVTEGFGEKGEDGEDLGDYRRRRGRSNRRRNGRNIKSRGQSNSPREVALKGSVVLHIYPSSILLFFSPFKEIIFAD